MKIIRWFFSHIILVLLIVVVIYGYMFWGRLVDSDTPGGKAIAYLSDKFSPANEGGEQGIVASLNAGEVSQEEPEDSNAKDVEETVESSVNTSRKALVVNTELSPDESSMASQHTKVSVNDAGSAIGGSVVSADVASINKAPFASSDAVEQVDSIDENRAAVNTDNTASLTSHQSKSSVNESELTIGDAMASVDANANASASTVGIVKYSFVPPDVEAKLNDIGEAVAASQVNTRLESPEVKASWITARASYHKRNYALSEKSYQQVIDNTEDNYDAYGELGNVYFNQGKNAQAASAYYEAAAILVRKGQLPRAESLVGLLWRLDPAKADELQQLIDSASS